MSDIWVIRKLPSVGKLLTFKKVSKDDGTLQPATPEEIRKIVLERIRENVLKRFPDARQIRVLVAYATDHCDDVSCELTPDDLEAKGESDE